MECEKNTQLKPCPFCGGPVKLVNTTLLDGNLHYGIAYMECESCGMKTRYYSTDGYYGNRIYTEEEIIEDWNEKIKILTDESQEGVAITLTVEEWQAVQRWLAFGADKSNASMVWWRDFCQDKKTGAETAAQYAKTQEEAERLYKIIDEALCPPKTEEFPQTARWIWDEHPEIDFDGYMCSKCGEKFNHKYYANVCEFKFCPHCGHPMNEEPDHG